MQTWLTLSGGLGLAWKLYFTMLATHVTSAKACHCHLQKGFVHHVSCAALGQMHTVMQGSMELSITYQSEGIEARRQACQKGRGPHQPDHEGRRKDAVCRIAEVEFALHMNQVWPRTGRKAVAAGVKARECTTCSWCQVWP